MSVIKSIVLFLWGGELLEADGFYLSRLSDMVWALGTLPLWTSTLHLWPMQGIIYAPPLPSSLPLPPVELSLKRHTEDLHAKLKHRCDEILPYKAVLSPRYVEVLCKADKKKKTLIFQAFRDNTLTFHLSYVTYLNMLYVITRLL